MPGPKLVRTSSAPAAVARACLLIGRETRPSALALSCLLAVAGCDAGAGDRESEGRPSPSSIIEVDVATSDAEPPAAAATTTHEAELAALSGGAAVATDHSGYTGTGFVAGYTDANKGSAATTFTIGAQSAGNATVALRYANGTTATMSLSLYVNGGKTGQLTLPPTANWDSWTTRTDTVALDAGENTIAYKFDTTDLGNVNLDNLAVTTAEPTPAGQYEAENAFFSGGPAVDAGIAGFTGTGYLTAFTANGARVIFTARTQAAGNRSANLRYLNTSGSAQAISVQVNGAGRAQLSLPSGSGWQTATHTVALRAGLNTIAYEHAAGDSGSVGVDHLAVSGGLALNARGATVPYTEYEAEDATTNGAVIGPDRTYLTVASESSGRRAVTLNQTGHHVRFTLTQPANSLVVRYSIPDSADGAGQSATLSLYADGAHVQDLALSSRYAWVYGEYPYTNTPSQGSPHRFYDETRALIGEWPAGTVLELRKDSSDTADYYTIDLIDTEQVAAAETMPAGFVSITDSGATPDDGSDDTAAINNAIAAARAAGQGLWIPPGTFDITTRLDVFGITIRGAGPWYSTLRGRDGKGGFFATGGGVRISDLAIAGDVSYRDDLNFDTGLEGNFGTGSLLQNIWLEHVKVGMWIDSGTDGLYAVGIRIRDTFADGVNLHADVVNARIDQTVVRNTGDDALAMFSEGSPVTGSAFTFNTVQLPMLANAIGIYGGNSNRATDNLLSDTVNASAGIAVSTRQFTSAPVPFSGTTTIARNTLDRTGGFEHNWQTSFGAIWIFADTSDITAPVVISENNINDSTYQGVLFSFGRTITNVVFDHVTIDGAGTYGIDINNVSGSASFSYTTVTGTGSGGLNNPGNYTIIRGPGNSGF